MEWKQYYTSTHVQIYYYWWNNFILLSTTGAVATKTHSEIHNFECQPYSSPLARTFNNKSVITRRKKMSTPKGWRIRRRVVILLFQYKLFDYTLLIFDHHSTWLNSLVYFNCSIVLRGKKLIAYLKEKTVLFLETTMLSRFYCFCVDRNIFCDRQVTIICLFFQFIVCERISSFALLVVKTE